ncbi:MAG: efflux transporter outer membrane subunit [Rubrivivax sp.]
MRAPVNTGRLGAIALASLALLQACSLTPEYQRPAAPVAAAFPETPAAPPVATAPLAAADLPWREFLADARLRALVDLALAGNRDLRVAVLTAEQARASAGAVRADLLPTVQAGATGTATSAVGGGSTRSYTAGLSITAWEIDLFGRLRSLSEAAQARYLASEEGRRAAQLSLVASVASADLALRADDELLALTAQTLATREQTLALAQARFKAGVAAEPELRSVKSLAAAARASLAALQRQRAQDLNTLALLLGQPLPANLPAGAPLASVQLPALPAGLPATVLLQRPDVRQAEQALLAANANIGAARAAFFPRLALTTQVGTASNALSGLFDNTAWTVAPSLLAPIFDAGRNSNNLAASRAAKEIAVAQYEKALQSAFREVADALAGRDTLGAQLAAQQQQADAETRRQVLAQQLFQGGAASALERLDAERSALAAQQAVLQVRLAALQNAVQLYRVLGGGTAVAEAPAGATKP